MKILTVKINFLDQGIQLKQATLDRSVSYFLFGLNVSCLQCHPGPGCISFTVTFCITQDLVVRASLENNRALGNAKRYSTKNNQHTFVVCYSNILPNIYTHVRGSRHTYKNFFFTCLRIPLDKLSI